MEFKINIFSSAFSSYCKRPTYSDEAFTISARTLFYTMMGQVWRAGNEQYHKKINQSVLLIEGENDKRNRQFGSKFLFSKIKIQFFVSQ